MHAPTRALTILCLSAAIAAQEPPARHHICSLRTPVGLLPALRHCASAPGATVVSGTLGASTVAGDGLWLDSVTVDDVLLGGEVADLLIERAITPTTGDMAPGEPGLWFAVPGEDGRLVAIEVIVLSSPDERGTLAVLQGLLQTTEPGARARVLIDALSGGSETRHRAVLDLESDARHLAALDDRGLARLATELSDADRDDPALGALLRLYACSGAGDRARVCLATLAGEAGERTLPELRGLLRVPAFGLTADDLDPLLAADQPIELQRRAVHLLARIPGETATTRLIEAAGAGDLDLGSEALVGLAGRCPPELIEACRAALMLALDTGPRRGEERALDRVLEGRDLQRLRTSPYTGERFRLMACGFVLARGDASEREWLARHVDAIADRNVGRFLAAMLASAWLDFEDPW